MLIKGGKIIAATKSELYTNWLKSEMFEIMDFDEYMFRLYKEGILIIKEESNETN